MIAATGNYTVVHSCAPGVPFGIIRAAGADAVSFDLSQLRRGEEDEVAEAAEAGMGLLTGAVPAVPARPRAGRGAPGGRRPAGAAQAAAEAAGPARRRTGHPAVAAAGAAAGHVRGAGGDHAGLRAGRRVPAQARAALTRCREAASMLPELIEETGGESR